MGDTSLVFALSTRDNTASGLRSARQSVEHESEAMVADVGESGAAAGSSFGESLKAGVAGAMLAVGALVAAGFAEAIDQSRLSSKLAAQLDLTKAESARVGKVAGALYADAYGDSFESVNTAVGAVVSSIKGVTDASSADLEDVTAYALDFATAFDVDVTRAAQVAGTAINSGLAKDATEAFDLITAASQKVPASLRENVLDAVDEYGQFFTTLGYSGEEAFALLVDAAEKGEFGIDKAGDAIKEFTILSTDLSQSSKDAYKTIRLDAEEMANAILAGGEGAKDATNKIIDGLLDIRDPADQAAAAIALFGTPLEDLNVKDIPDFLESLKGASGSMDDFEGATSRAGDTLRDNAATRVTAFKRSIEQNIVDFLGGTVIPAVTTFKDRVVDAFSSMWAEAGKGGTEGVDRVLAFFEILGERLVAKVRQLAPRAIQGLIQLGQDLAAWISANPEQIFKIAAVTAIIIAAFAGLPHLIVGTLLVAAATIITSFVNRMMVAAQEKLGQLGSSIGGWFSRLWSTYIANPVRGTWNQFIASVRTLPARAAAALSALGSRLSAAATDAWSDFQGAAVRKQAEFIRWVNGIPGRISRAVGSLDNLLYGKGQDLIRGLVAGVRSMGAWLAYELTSFARSKIPGPIAKALGINSPSKVLADEIGRWLPPGIVQGIEDNQGVLDTSLQGMVQPSLAVPGGSHSPIAAAPGAGTVRVVLDVQGADQEMARLFRKLVRVEGGGSVQTAFGR